MQENLLGLVEQAGVVGAGGAGFPTHVKLKAQADTVIINGAECEPLLRVDQQLMALQAGDLLDALDLLVEQVALAAAMEARPIPVLPLVGSMITLPGFSRPFASASSIMPFAILSFTLPAGLKYSILP